MLSLILLNTIHITGKEARKKQISHTGRTQECALMSPRHYIQRRYLHRSSQVLVNFDARHSQDSKRYSCGVPIAYRPLSFQLLRFEKTCPSWWSRSLPYGVLQNDPSVAVSAFSASAAASQNSSRACSACRTCAAPKSQPRLSGCNFLPLPVCSTHIH
jgi:hypothetical protein